MSNSVMIYLTGDMDHTDAIDWDVEENTPFVKGASLPDNLIRVLIIAAANELLELLTNPKYKDAMIYKGIDDYLVMEIFKE